MRSLSHLNDASNRIIHLLGHCASPVHIRQIQAQLVLQSLQSDTTVARHFITACESLGLLDAAHLLYTHLRRPHVFICNNLIRAFSHAQSHHYSVSMYNHMNRNSIRPNHYTFPFILKSLSDLRDLEQGLPIHTQIIKLGHGSDIYVQNSLLNVYAAGGRMDLCQRVFDEMSQRDVVSWTVMIAGYREAAKFDDALITFERMQYAGVVPNRVTMVNALSVCSSFGAIDMGVWIHCFIRNHGWDLDVILGTSLIDMYGKCGRIEEGFGVFLSMKEKNVFTWNALIKGLALAKSGEEALRWFLRMEQEGIEPDEVTLIGVLCACSYAGMVQMGWHIFCSLIDGQYGFSAGIKHYACMIDLLARAGCLEDAFKLIKEMPFSPNKAMWGAFLGGCRAHGNLEMSEFAAWKLIELAPENSGYYVLLSNLYAEMGRWRDVENVRKLMKEKELEKDLGCSSVELEP